MKSKFTFAQILIGKITLDRAIKHLQNRLSLPLPFGKIYTPEIGGAREAVATMEDAWADLDKEEKKLRAARGEKAGRA
jgi:hypothetical protein